MIMETAVPQTMLGTASTCQFKAGVKNTDSLASEMVAFANADDSVIFIDVANGGVMLRLPRPDVRCINQPISHDALTTLHDICCLNCGNIGTTKSEDLAGTKEMTLSG